MFRIVATLLCYLVLYAVLLPHRERNLSVVVMFDTQGFIVP